LANPQEGRLAVDFLVYGHSSSEDLDHLMDNGFRLITRHLIPCGSIITDPFETQLIIDALDICNLAKIDVVVLVSGDADYASLCYALRRRGIIVEVASFVKIPGKLRQSASKFIDLNKWIYTFDTQSSEFPKTDQSLSVLANKPLTIIHAGSIICKSPEIDHNKTIKLNSITNIYDSFSEVSSGIEVISNNNKVSIPSFSFYINGEFWSIDEQGKKKHLKDLNGLLMLNMLLRYPHEPISSFTLFHEGKEIESDIVVPFYKVSDDIKSTSSKEGVDTLAISIKPSHQPKYDEGGKSILKSSIAELEEELALIDQTSFEDPIKKLEKEDEIKGLIQEYKKEMNSNKYQDWATGEDNARVSVNKNIKRALKKVIAELIYLESYLNRHTIVTGK